MKIELRHLRTLLAIEEGGGFVAAAGRLHLTQSALSHQVKALEAQLDTVLFHRAARPLRPTAAGERLLDLARRVLPEVDGTLRQLERLQGGQSGRLHLALECHSCFQWLLPALDAYRAQWPEVETDVSLGFSFHALPALLRGAIDLVVTADPDPLLGGIRYLPLFRHEVRLAVAAEAPLARRASVEPQDLAGETVITYPVCRSRLDIFQHFLTPAGVEPAAVRTAELTALLVQLVASRRGVAALPAWALAEHQDRRRVTSVALGRDGLWSTLYAAVREEDAALPYVEAFVGLSRHIGRERLAGIRGPGY
ncbi:LysR family transcriptional regulator [Sediminicurvatus halobius]|uniref:HTH-type transcriptional regulator MetR n=1 Tax=Sediminicurvatus halobius TaxID=2182432 RepID=A0A2U2N9H2_9GAMM|nr:LysR family transcriptional regulator [Spiribacter halobius]PWG65733.1 LysR family transcriptional regulator [Spiribacter halobius]UEX77768.1 LysR family transcriptional regulator [Spiribacter halobius]